MLVGEHGRIIPIRHVKGIAILLIVTLISALIALGILLFFYLRQSADLDQLRTHLADTAKQLAQMRDEKDMLLAKLVIENKIPIEKKAAPPVEDDKEEGNEMPAVQQPPEPAPVAVPAPTPVPEAAPAKEKPPEPPPAPKPEVKWGANVRNFKVDYQHERSILQAVFRIYNTSRPKEPLSGRAVVIFRQGDEMPMKWLTVPRVQLENGTPSGKNGQAFKINNYRTMTFKAFGLKPPIDYDTAAVFVFTADGEMIFKEEFGFKVELPPPPPPQPKAPEPSPPADTVDIKPGDQTEDQSPQTLFPLQPSGSGSKLPPILQNNEPIQLEPEKTAEDSPAPGPDGEATQAPAPAESSPSQPEGEKKE